MAGLKSGAGLVTMASPPGATMVLASHLTAIMQRTIRDEADLQGWLSDKRLSAFVIGPGFGNLEVARSYCELLAATGRPVVLDADDDEATVTISFKALNDPEGKGPFVDISGRTTSSEITSATATLELSGASLLVGTFTGSNGYTGTVYGSFVGTSGIILPFELSTDGGDVIYGVIVADTTLGG